MPYSIRKLPKKDLYRVYNTETKVIHSYATTLENAKKQVKLLHMVDAGVPLKKQGGSISNPKLLELFKGTGSVGKQAKKMGFQVTSLDLDPIYTPDIETDILEWDYKKWSNENNYVPDMIWSSPPCNTFSPMVYRLKERDVETAKPLSERAKLGTKILYKTLEIIDYFLKKNPKLLFIIENPRGMMRKDKEMKKLARETTLYCLYGDFKKKPTDFWNNFPSGLNLDQETKQCPNATIPVQISKGVKNLNLDQRYSMPSKLIKHFLDEFKKQYKEKVGAGIETDRYEDKGEVSLPEFKSVQIDLPTYMYKRMPDIKGKPPPYKYKLVNPITETRTIASRKKEKAVDIKRKPIGIPNFSYEEADDLPIVDDFSPKDQEKLEAYYDEVKKNEKKDRNEIANQPANNLPRGFPITMYKTADRMGYKKTDEKVYKRKVVVEKPEKPRKEKTSGKPVGRPKSIRKQAVLEEEPDDLFAKLTQGEVASRGSSRAPSKTSEKSVSDISSLSSLAKESEKSISTAKSSSKASSVKSSKSSSAGSSESGIDDDDLDAFLENQYKKKLGLGILGKGINKISNNSNMANSWITYVKEYAAKNGMSYRDALRDPNCKAGYKKGGVVKKGRGVVDEMGGQALLAVSYNDSELGANAGKKFISL